VSARNSINKSSKKRDGSPSINFRGGIKKKWARGGDGGMTGFIQQKFNTTYQELRREGRFVEPI